MQTYNIEVQQVATLKISHDVISKISKLIDISSKKCTVFNPWHIARNSKVARPGQGKLIRVLGF